MHLPLSTLTVDNASLLCISFVQLMLCWLVAIQLFYFHIGGSISIQKNNSAKKAGMLTSGRRRETIFLISNYVLTNLKLDDVGMSTLTRLM